MIHSLFISHGGPTLAIEENEYTSFLKDLGKSIKPKAIVIFTAHFESKVTTISSIDNTYNMIYDFYGFPGELYSIKYNAQGSTGIANKVKNMLKQSGIDGRLDTERGLDHGSWVILHIMYPEANIPVVQISVDPFLPIEKQYEIGKAIRELGKEDILVIGSGGTVHNLRTINWDAKETENWALEFDDWLIENVKDKKLKSLFDYQKQAPNAKLAVPREEHLVPMFITMGSGQEGNVPKLLHRSYEYGTLSYICFEF
jgi:4,5-DOPA dioxygenase extradiol